MTQSPAASLGSYISSFFEALELDNAEKSQRISQLRIHIGESACQKSVRSLNWHNAAVRKTVFDVFLSRAHDPALLSDLAFLLYQLNQDFPEASPTKAESKPSSASPPSSAYPVLVSIEPPSAPPGGPLFAPAPISSPSHQTNADSNGLRPDGNEQEECKKKEGKYEEDDEEEEETKVAASAIDTGNKNAPVPVSSLPLPSDSMAALAARNISHLQPIEMELFNAALQGIDIVADSASSTGFFLPCFLAIVQTVRRLRSTTHSTDQPTTSYHRIRCLVLAPTREMAIGIQSEIKTFGRELSVIGVFGGTSYQAQVQAINQGVDILVGTPGRTQDLMQQGRLSFPSLSVVVICGFDRLLDLGFELDLVRIIQQTPQALDKGRCQSILLEEEHLRVAQRFIDMFFCPDYKRITEPRQAPIPENSIWHVAIPIGDNDRFAALRYVLERFANVNEKRAVVFAETKRDVAFLFESPLMNGKDFRCLTGDIPQETRRQTLTSFHSNEFKYLIVTDVAARDLVFPPLGMIVHMEPSKNSGYEVYAHRVNRLITSTVPTPSSVVFHSPSSLYLIEMMEKTAGIRFERFNLPSPIPSSTTAPRT